MKKRVVALLLALVVLCTGVMLTACGGNEAPPETVAKKSVADVINEAMEKTGALDEMSAVMKMEMNMAAEGMTMSIPITAKMKAKDLGGENMIMSVAMTMSMFGQDINIEMYQEGQWAYVVMGDMKYKSDIQALEGEFDYTDSANDMLKEIPEELLKDVEPVTAEDGSQTVTVAFPAEKFAEVYSDLIQEMNSETGTEVGEMKISDAVVTVTMAEGYVTVCDVAFTMDMTVEDVSTTTEAKATITYEDPGQPVTITPPEGYQDFEEISMDDSLL